MHLIQINWPAPTHLTKQINRLRRRIWSNFTIAFSFPGLRILSNCFILLARTAKKWVISLIKWVFSINSFLIKNLVPLSPLPKVPLNALSPRKLINERINVVPLSQYAQSVSHSRFGGLHGVGRRYDFHKSPSKVGENKYKKSVIILGFENDKCNGQRRKCNIINGQQQQYWTPNPLFTSIERQFNISPMKWKKRK